ncbi:Uncharacterised protein [Streptococcus pneumoniae]|nr:Uncharacterised protein [Streptococcus pneumoniae]
MVLDHVTEGTGLVIVATTFFYTQALRKGNLNIVDKILVPNVFKNQVCKANCKDALDHFLTKIMVNTENLFFVKCC